MRWSSRDIAVVKADFTPMPSARDMTSLETIIRDGTNNNTLLLQDFRHRLSTMPEVASVGTFSPIPFSKDATRAGQFLPPVYKRPGDPIALAIPAIMGYANPEGFDMLGITLLSGRHFTSADTAAALGVDRLLGGSGFGVAIVNESLAQRFWPEENPVGKIIYDSFTTPYEIVGVVRDYHQGIGDNKNIVSAMYLPPTYQGSFLVRLHSRSLMKDLRQRLSGLDSGAVSFEMHPLDEVVSGATANIRLTLQLLGGFAFLGIIVSGLGVYATTSLMIASMNREMGIRMAIGAQTWDILRLALWRGMRAILLGLPFGLFLAWVLSRMLSGYLFQVKVDDTLAWIISSAALFCITIIAALIPAVRVSRVNPMDVLRNG